MKNETQAYYGLRIIYLLVCVIHLGGARIENVVEASQLTINNVKSRYGQGFELRLDSIVGRIIKAS